MSFKRPRTDFNHARLCSLVTLGPSECHWRNSSPHWREFHLPENMKMGKSQPIISEYTMSDQIGSWYLVKRPKQLRRMLRPRFVILASHSPQLFLPPGIALSTHLPLKHHRLAAGAGQKEVLLGLVLRQRRAVARGSQLRRPIAPLFYPYQVSCSPDVVFSLLHSPPPMTWCKDKMNHD